MQDGFSGFLKHAGLVIKLLKLQLLQKSLHLLSISSLKSPSFRTWQSISLTFSHCCSVFTYVSFLKVIGTINQPLFLVQDRTELLLKTVILQEYPHEHIIESLHHVYHDQVWWRDQNHQCKTDQVEIFQQVLFLRSLVNQCYH